MRSKLLLKHETSLQSAWLRICFNQSIEDHFWHIIMSWIFSDSRRCQICIWTLRSKKFVIDSLFSFTKRCFFFLIRKISFERSSEISEKIDVSTFVFSIVIQRANRLYATSKFAIFSDSSVSNRLKMLHEMILTSQSWLMRLSMFIFEIWYS
jgi:hypothetical protein